MRSLRPACGRTPDSGREWRGGRIRRIYNALRRCAAGGGSPERGGRGGGPRRAPLETMRGRRRPASGPCARRRSGGQTPSGSWPKRHGTAGATVRERSSTSRWAYPRLVPSAPESRHSSRTRLRRSRRSGRKSVGRRAAVAAPTRSRRIASSPAPRGRRSRDKTRATGRSGRSGQCGGVVAT